MEPMNLGSPVNTPVHLGAQPSFAGYQSPVPGVQPQFHSTMVGAGGAIGQSMTPLGQSPVVAGSQMQPGNPGTPGFLPGYLIGSFPQQPSNRVMSPTKLNRSMSTTSSANTPSGATGNPKPVNGFLTPTTPAPRTPSEKTGGPPIKGLYSNTPSKEFGTPLTGTGTPQRLGSTPCNTTPQLSFGATATPNAFKELDVTDTGYQDGNTWVTVFGFPPSAASYILSQFSQCGTILQHHIPPNGNWMNIRFQTKMQAQKALGRTGRIFGGSLMVGVSPCLEPPADATANASQILDHTSNQDTSVMSLNSSLATHNRSIRPLTQSFKAAHNEHDVSGIVNTPNKNSGIVTKAVEYIFGW